jgi:hypothetical protein
MSKYMMILGGADLDKRSGNPDVAPVMFTRYMEWVGELQRNGSYVGGHKLHDQGGARLTVRGGQVVEGATVAGRTSAAAAKARGVRVIQVSLASSTTAVGASRIASLAARCSSSTAKPSPR